MQSMVNRQDLLTATAQNSIYHHSLQYPLLRTPPTPILGTIDLPCEDPLFEIAGYNQELCYAEISIGARGVDVGNLRLLWQRYPELKNQALSGLSIMLEHGAWTPEDGYSSINSILNSIRDLGALKKFRLIVSQPVPDLNIAYHHSLLKFRDLTTITLRGCAIPVSDCLSILSASAVVNSFEVDSLQDIDSTINPVFYPVPSGVSLPALKSLTVFSSVDPLFLWEHLFMPNLNAIYIYLDFNAAQSFDPHNGVFKWGDYEAVTIKGAITCPAFQYLTNICTKPGQLRVISPDVYAY